MNVLNTIVALVVSIGTALVGNTIHHSIFWSVVDFVFWPIAWIKWLCCHEVSMVVIRETFGFFFN